MSRTTLTEGQTEKIEALACLVRELRAIRGWSVQDLAERADVSPQTIYKIEGGGMTRPGVTTLSKVAAAFDATAADLLDEVGL
ncbi:helix-turn-helix transcriptional regulator [Salinibacter altiplanensis]|uniref:helix-turn-helix transcriptional regulator n=1 Tax=Salinibacter altiplanensis TaxID=1803181 RepID=UPI000C9F5B83|nr:helix-turn-helix transcriptional regulator [Salinibacter altiplanensis]